MLRGGSRLRQAGAVLCAALGLAAALSLWGCDSKPKVTEAGRQLDEIQAEIDLAMDLVSVQEVVSDCLRIAEEQAGNPDGDRAYSMASSTLSSALEWSDPEYYYEDADLPAIPRGYASEISRETHVIRAACGFALECPAEYRDRAYAIARSAAATMAVDWSAQLIDVAAKRTAWVGSMQKRGKSEDYGSFSEEQQVDLSYARELVSVLPGSDEVANALARIDAGVDHSIKNHPKATKYSSSSSSMTAYYTSSEVARASADARKLTALARSAQSAVQDLQ